MIRFVSSSLGLLLWVIGMNSCTLPPTGHKETEGCPAGTVNTSANEPGEISSISTEDFVLLHQTGELFLIDSRNPWFFRQGRIPGAVNLPNDEAIDANIDQLHADMKDAVSKGLPIVVYCNGLFCHDARTICRAISDAGLDVTKFGGGWKAWKNFDLPIESASQAVDDLSPQPSS